MFVSADEDCVISPLHSRVRSSHVYENEHLYSLHVSAFTHAYSYVITNTQDMVNTHSLSKFSCPKSWSGLIPQQ